MATRTVYRKADISSAEAIKSLSAGFPGSELVSFISKKASAAEAQAAGAKEGDLVYEATVRTAEFPPSDTSDDSGDDSGDDAPTPSKESEGEDKSDSKPESDSGDGDGDADDKGGDDKGGAPDFGGGEHKKPSVEEQILHVLTELLHAVKGGGDLGAGPDAGMGGPDAGLPDIGAPGQGDTLPPPDGAPGAPHGAPPLPPPVKEKAPIGGAAFSHYDPAQANITLIRRELEGIKNKALIAEASELYPTHKVARIQRTGSATIDGLKVNLPESDVAVVTLVKK